jgi:hypothetical protein
MKTRKVRFLKGFMSVKTKKVLSRIKKKKILFLWEKVIFAFVGNYFHGK